MSDESVKTGYPYAYNNGSSLGGTTWSTPNDDDGGYDPSPSLGYSRDDDEYEM